MMILFNNKIDIIIDKEKYYLYNYNNFYYVIGYVKSDNDFTCLDIGNFFYNNSNLIFYNINIYYNFITDKISLLFNKKDVL